MNSDLLESTFSDNQTQSLSSLSVCLSINYLLFMCAFFAKKKKKKSKAKHNKLKLKLTFE
jgi:hypothetical protein